MTWEGQLSVDERPPEQLDARIAREREPVGQGCRRFQAGAAHDFIVAHRGRFSPEADQSILRVRAFVLETSF